jgi:methyl-accepting chemotaxis protein
MTQSTQLQASPSGAAAAKPRRRIGLRGRMLALATIPLLLSGLIVLVAFLVNASQLTNRIYEDKTNRTLKILMGNINLFSPAEIDREFKQAMASSDFLAMHLITRSGAGQLTSQTVFRDDQAKAAFEALEPAYAAASKQGKAAQNEFFSQLNGNTSTGRNVVSRGSGLGGSQGATETKMLTLGDVTSLSVPASTAAASGFSLVAVENIDSLQAGLLQIAWTTIAIILVALIAAIVTGILVARSIVGPILNLTAQAEAMSIGDLETPITVKSKDEIGTLAQALERTRLSLRLALERTQRKHT